jgi:hypothetical protein
MRRAIETLSAISPINWLAALDDFRNWFIREAASMADF